MTSIVRGRILHGALFATIVLAVPPTLVAGQSSPWGSVGLTIGYDAIPEGDAVLDDGGPSVDVGAGAFIARHWQLGVGAGVKYGSETCFELVESGSSESACGLGTDLYSFHASVRYWFRPPGGVGSVTPFVGAHTGLALRVKDGGGAPGVPLGADYGIMIPAGARFHILASLFIERLFFQQEFERFDADRTATRAGVRAGIGWLLP